MSIFVLMETAKEINKLRELFDHFHALLSGYYSKSEISSMLYILFEELLKMNRVDVALNPHKVLTKLQLQEISKAVYDLKRFKPVQYIIGKTTFLDLDFIVSPDVLIPRPETEELVQWVIDENKNIIADILDIGSSSGCVAICLDKYIKKSKVYGIDINEKALEVARQNNQTLEAEASFLLFDIFDEARWDELGQFDLIVSNPPYVRESEKDDMSKNVLDYEPSDALFVSDDDPLVFYRTILMFSASHLKKAGKIYFEINEAFGPEMVALLEEKGFIDVVLRKDINDRDRFVSGKRLQ